jgi:hypothetical protein
MVIVDKPSISVEWEPRGKWIRVNFKRFIEGDEYRSTLDAALDVAIAKNATRLLWDLRQMKVLTPEDQAWAEREWTPRLLKASKVRCTALVVPRSVLAQMTLRRVAEKTAPMTENEVTSKHFDSVEDAEKWLLTSR